MTSDFGLMKPTIKDLIRTLRSQAMLIRGVGTGRLEMEGTSPLPSISFIYLLYLVFVYLRYLAREWYLRLASS